MLKIYDDMELNHIKKSSRDYSSTFSLNYDDIDPSIDMNQFEEIMSSYQAVQGDYLSLQAGGRMNYELTPYRLKIVSLKIEMIELLGSDSKALIFEGSSYSDLLLEQKRLQHLQDNLIPDDFNKYTVTAANLPAKLFEGYFLFLIFMFTLLLFYDLFSKDFDLNTYRNIYSTTYRRSQLIQSKVIFSFLYLIVLIFITFLLMTAYLLLIKRKGYNVIPSRSGSLLQLRYFNSNVISIITKKPQRILISTTLYNLITILIGSSMIMVWNSLICLLSFKLKSSNNTLVISVYIMLTIYYFNQSLLRTSCGYIIPLTLFDFQGAVEGIESINGPYMFMISCLYSLITLSLLNKNINTMDLLDGNHND